MLKDLLKFIFLKVILGLKTYINIFFLITSTYIWIIASVFFLPRTLIHKDDKLVEDSFLNNGVRHLSQNPHWRCFLIVECICKRTDDQVNMYLRWVVGFRMKHIMRYGDVRLFFLLLQYWRHLYQIHLNLLHLLILLHLLLWLVRPHPTMQEYKSTLNY
jgi:hypothetical protein